MGLSQMKLSKIKTDIYNNRKVREYSYNKNNFISFEEIKDIRFLIHNKSLRAIRRNIAEICTHNGKRILNQGTGNKATIKRIYHELEILHFITKSIYLHEFNKQLITIKTIKSS